MGIHGLGGMPPKQPQGLGSTSQGGSPAPQPPSNPTAASTSQYISQLRDWIDDGNGAYGAKGQATGKSFALFYLDSLKDQTKGASPSDLNQIISNLQKAVVSPSGGMLQLATIMGQSLGTYEGISSTLQTGLMHLNKDVQQLQQVESYAENLQNQISQMKDGKAKTNAEKDFSACEKTITQYKTAIANLQKQASSQIEPFLKTFEGTWNTMMSDFNSYAQNPSDTTYQKICNEHGQLPNWLTPEQSAFVEGNPQTKALGTDQIYYGFSALEAALTNVDRDIHNGSAPTPQPWPGPGVKPTPPSGDNINNGSTMDFIHDAQAYLANNAGNYSKQVYQFLSNFLSNEANQANGVYDKTSLQNIINDINKVVINPSSQMKEAIPIMAQFDAEYTSYTNQLSGMINRMGMLENEISQDQEAIARFKKAGSSDPTAMKQLKAVKKDLASREKDLKTLEKQKNSLEKELDKAKKLNSKVQSEFNTLIIAKTPSGMNKYLNRIEKNTKDFSGKLNSKDAATLKSLNDINTAITADENKIVAVRQDLVKKKKMPPPPKLPPGQMYIQSNMLQHIFSLKGAAQTQAIDNYLAELKKQNIDTLDIAFAQVADIESGGPSTSGATADTVFQMIQQNPAAWKAFETEVNKQGFKLDVSFGGQNAQAADWKIPQGQGAAYAQALIKDFTVNGKLMVTKFDFDVELQGFANGDIGDLKAFFTTLHDGVKAQGGQVLLTSMGSVTDWVGVRSADGKSWTSKGPLFDLFFDESTTPPTPSFTKMFDGLNLMMYSQTDYYLDAKNTDGDSIEDWLDIIGKQNAGMLHLGFEDNVPYTGGHNPIWAPTEGQAAAKQYEQLLTQLQQDGYIGPDNQLGGVFFWPDSNINSSSDMPNQQFEQDFYDELNRWNSINR